MLSPTPRHSPIPPSNGPTIHVTQSPTAAIHSQDSSIDPSYTSSFNSISISASECESLSDSFSDSTSESAYASFLTRTLIRSPIHPLIHPSIHSLFNLSIQSPSTLLTHSKKKTEWRIEAFRRVVVPRLCPHRLATARPNFPQVWDDSLPRLTQPVQPRLSTVTHTHTHTHTHTNSNLRAQISTHMQTVDNATVKADQSELATRSAVIRAVAQSRVKCSAPIRSRHLDYVNMKKCDASAHLSTAEALCCLSRSTHSVVLPRPRQTPAGEVYHSWKVVSTRKSAASLRHSFCHPTSSADSILLQLPVLVRPATGRLNFRRKNRRYVVAICFGCTKVV
ncbi:unnamed protein product [Protopolystoma xenopodis]|uniref:Uncharacterized protein n=1 Tax=Protopolystoma xenopodis TaxID=117903 RepID=A0A448XID8_9PLAT|nr:unnamed protein product [Protopolystoma xenopodis]